MSEIITTLEDLQDLPALTASLADTIMISLDGLSSSGAVKIKEEDMAHVITEIKDAGKNVAVLANLTLHEGMITKADQLLSQLKNYDIHAIFFSDPSLYALAKNHGLKEHLIYNPETLMTSINDASWWLDRGIEGIAVSPILTLQETEEIVSATKKAVVTVHGRTLMSRSYRKLLTAYQEINQLDTTLDQKKDLYLVEVKRQGNMPVYEDETGTLIYSDNVLDSFDFITEVLASQPMGLLIEGSFISCKEQVEAVRAYRRILDSEDPSVVGKEYREQFKDEPLDSGYYEQKTVR